MKKLSCVLALISSVIAVLCMVWIFKYVAVATSLADTIFIRDVWILAGCIIALQLIASISAFLAGKEGHEK